MPASERDVFVDVCKDGRECGAKCREAGQVVTRRGGLAECAWCLVHWAELRERYRVQRYSVTCSPAVLELLAA